MEFEVFLLGLAAELSSNFLQSINFFFPKESSENSNSLIHKVGYGISPELS